MKQKKCQVKVNQFFYQHPKHRKWFCRLLASLEEAKDCLCRSR
ncbi:hypothetical protein [Anaerostipes caccae]|nr:hypothetical protein [Anaerostipes caccae]UWN72045.1 hypothetical protein NQ561_02445 [Anaerostipes caccae L1-92]